MKGIYIVYEWAIYTDCTEIHETDGSTWIDYNGDVHFHDTYAGVADMGEPDEMNVIELQRSHRYVEDGDLIERYSAVLKKGRLPAFFDGSQIAVPKRFYDEINNYKEKTS